MYIRPLDEASGDYTSLTTLPRHFVNMRCTSKWDQFSTRHARFQAAPVKPVTPVIPLQNGYNTGVTLATRTCFLRRWSCCAHPTVQIARQPTLVMTPMYNSNVLVPSPGPATPAYYATPGLLYTPITTTTHVPILPHVCYTYSPHCVCSHMW